MEYSKNVIENISVKEKEQITTENEEEISEYKDNIEFSIQLKCHKCKEIVSPNNKFNDDLQK